MRCVLLFWQNFQQDLIQSEEIITFFGNNAQPACHQTGRWNTLDSLATIGKLQNQKWDQNEQTILPPWSSSLQRKVLPAWYPPLTMWILKDWYHQLPCKYAELHPGAHCTKNLALIAMQTCRASTRHQVHKIQQKCRANIPIMSLDQDKGLVSSRGHISDRNRQLKQSLLTPLSSCSKCSCKFSMCSWCSSVSLNSEHICFSTSLQFTLWFIANATLSLATNSSASFAYAHDALQLLSVNSETICFSTIYSTTVYTMKKFLYLSLLLPLILVADLWHPSPCNMQFQSLISVPKSATKRFTIPQP